MIEITNINDTRIGHYRNLKNSIFTHTKNNFFLAEGSIVTEKLLQSNLDVLSIFALPSFFDLFAELLNKKNIPEESKFTANKNLMNLIVGFHLHQGIMAIGKIPEQTNLLKLKPPIIALNGIINSENVGAIVRNAAAFGINSIIFDKQTSHPYLRRAVRVSMGTIFLVNYYQSLNLSHDLKTLQTKNKFEIIASELTQNSIPIYNFKFKNKSAIIFGSEGKGISKDILSICDKIIHIPINEKVKSINVASSTSIIFHHIKKQF